jgi:hypothetical protein
VAEEKVEIGQEKRPLAATAFAGRAPLSFSKIRGT